jgi:diadenosine tetraphosphate (Ap4A) HIT family hydrolase
MTMNPFIHKTQLPLIALKGNRKGYLQLAPSEEITSFQQLSLQFFQAAQAWATHLEDLGAKRIYWITLSEVVPHLHIHLYPRWREDEPKGLALFEKRDEMPQPLWPEDPFHEINQVLNRWAREYSVCIL